MTRKSKAEPKASKSPTPVATRSETLIALMRSEGGATAKALADAVGWQVHSVRGFIAGQLKKRSDLIVSTQKVDGTTRYSISHAKAADA